MEFEEGEFSTGVFFAREFSLGGLFRHSYINVDGLLVPGGWII